MSTPADQIVLAHDGQELALHVHADPGDGAPVLLFLPAMGTPAGFYRRFAGELSAAGVWPMVGDLRGTGASRPLASRSAAYGYAALAADVDVLLAEVARRAPGRAVVLGGHSLGGQMAAIHLSRAGSPARGLFLIGTAIPHFRRYGRRGAGLLAMTQVMALGSRVVGYWPGWAFGGRQARGTIRDWAHTARTGRYPELDGAVPDLTKIDVPVLCVTLGADLLTPRAATHDFTDRMTGTEVTHVDYAFEDGREADHFTWAKESGPLAAQVADFVREATR
ncbi:MAG: alpha/beta fold hydrolase [Micrococcales bacterium]|nr:alpha/beta fold hydrolase [Micrococcales bacterium]